MDYSTFIGRIAIGRLQRTLKQGQQVSLISREGEVKKSRIKELYVFEGLGKAKVDMVSAGDLCAIVGLEGFEIGDTVADIENPESLPTIRIDEQQCPCFLQLMILLFSAKENSLLLDILRKG